MSRDLKIDVWYGLEQRFGHHGLPQRYINILGRVSSPVGVNAIRWEHKGQWHPLTLGPTAFRLRSLGDFNAEVAVDQLEEGPQTLRLVATDIDGDEVVTEVKIHLTRGDAPSLPMTIDWSASKNINDAAQVVDGLWRLDGEGVRPVETHYDRIIALGDMRWTDYQVTVPMTIHRFVDTPASYRWPSFGHAAGVMVRWQGHEDWGDLWPRRGYTPFGGLAFYGFMREHQDRRALISGGRGGNLIDDPSGFELELGRRYMMKFRVQSRVSETSRYAVKYWPADEPEPEAWLLEADGQEGELSAGCALLVAHHTDVTYGNVLVEPA